MFFFRFRSCSEYYIHRGVKIDILKVTFFELYYGTKTRKKTIKNIDFDLSMYIVPATRPKTKKKLSAIWVLNTGDSRN